MVEKIDKRHQYDIIEADGRAYRPLDYSGEFDEKNFRSFNFAGSWRVCHHPKPEPVRRHPVGWRTRWARRLAVRWRLWQPGRNRVRRARWRNARQQHRPDDGREQGSTSVRSSSGALRADAGEYHLCPASAGGVLHTTAGVLYATTTTDRVFLLSVGTTVTAPSWWPSPLVGVAAKNRRGTFGSPAFVCMKKFNKVRPCGQP